MTASHLDALFAEYRKADQLLAAARQAPPTPAGLSTRPEPSTQGRGATPTGIEQKQPIRGT